MPILSQVAKDNMGKYHVMIHDTYVHLGTAEWYCDPETAPDFATPEPDRSRCQEEWIEDVVDLVEEGNETATNIMDEILLNLNDPGTGSGGVSGGGLLELTQLIPRITLLQAEQVAEGNVEGEEVYGASAYDVINALFAR